MTTRRLLTPRELADILAEHPKTVAKHTRQGVYNTFAINLADPGKQPRWRYDPARLEKWLDTRRTAAWPRAAS